MKKEVEDISQYRFQPEPLTSFIYWSVTLFIFFVGLVITLERSHIFWGSFVIWSIFVFFIWLGLKRYIIFDEKKVTIHSLLKRNRKTIYWTEITKIKADKNSLLLITKEASYHLLIGKKGLKKLIQKEQQYDYFKNRLCFVKKIEIKVN